MARRRFIGISGFDYESWRGVFYPRGLPRARWLNYAAARFNSIELNGTFYSLKSPETYRRWTASVPAHFVFAVKGSRFITHNLKLGNVEGPLANFYASGVLALGIHTGPFIWQLPPALHFDPARLERFLKLLPKNTTDAEALARGHDHRLRKSALLEAVALLRYRHALEVRHESFKHKDCFAMLRAHNTALVVADTAGRYPLIEEPTSDFMYVRLHGSRVLYASAYTPHELRHWAHRIRNWRSQDVYVYFDNDAEGHAPRDASELAKRLASHR